MSREARHNPVNSKIILDAGDVPVGQDHPRDMKSTGPAEDSLDDALIEPVDGMPGDEKLAELAFMDETIGIVVAETTDKLAPPIAEVWNDGRVQRFMRGTEQQVKRRYVEVLARCRRTTFTQQKVKDEEGNDTIRNIPHTALMFPFAITRDSARGRQWLKRILQEA